MCFQVAVDPNISKNKQSKAKLKKIKSILVLLW